jgi:hypothetical protein
MEGNFPEHRINIAPDMSISRLVSAAARADSAVAVFCAAWCANRNGNGVAVMNKIQSAALPSLQKWIARRQLSALREQTVHDWAGQRCRIHHRAEEDFVGVVGFDSYEGNLAMTRHRGGLSTARFLRHERTLQRGAPRYRSGCRWQRSADE